MNMGKSELICLGERCFKVEEIENERGTFGVAIQGPYLNKEGKEKVNFIMFTWDGLWNNLGSVANEMRNIGFIMEHTVTFNRIFRDFLRRTSYGNRIVELYEEELKWKRQNRLWRKQYGKN